MSKATQSPCEIVEIALVEDSGLKGNHHLEQHIAGCSHCQQLVGGVERVKATLRQLSDSGCGGEKDRVHLQLREQFQALHQPRRSVLKWMKERFRAPIPTYQAAIGFSLVLLLFAFFRPSALESPESTPASLSQLGFVDSTSHYHQLKDSFDAIYEHNLGGHLKHDTLFSARPALFDL